MIGTNNFSEESDPKLLCTCGHKDCDNRAVNQVALNKLQMIRDDINQPMIITSGGRCSNHPNEVNKTKPGDHQKCMAVDVLYKTEVQRNKLMVLAGRHGATRVAAGKGFVHIAWTHTYDRSVPSWTY